MSTIYDKCPYVTTQKVLQGKWAIVVLYHLSTGTKRFNELERLIPLAEQKWIDWRGKLPDDYVSPLK